MKSRFAYLACFVAKEILSKLDLMKRRLLANWKNHCFSKKGYSCFKGLSRQSNLNLDKKGNFLLFLIALIHHSQHLVPDKAIIARADPVEFY
jgi:hypothetical protein